jgi:hypothetical protein
MVNLQRGQIRRNLLNESKLQTIEYLGCNIDFFKDYITRKMTGNMTFATIQLDHIKPVSAFDLDDPDQFLQCCHWSNYQPLFPADNMSKNHRWSESDNEYWINNIYEKEYLPSYIPPII